MSAPVLFGELGVVAIQSLTRLRQRRELKIAQMSIIDESPHQQRAHLVPCLHFALQPPTLLSDGLLRCVSVQFTVWSLS